MFRLITKSSQLPDKCKPVELPFVYNTETGEYYTLTNQGLLENNNNYIPNLPIYKGTGDADINKLMGLMFGKGFSILTYLEDIKNTSYAMLEKQQTLFLEVMSELTVINGPLRYLEIARKLYTFFKEGDSYQYSSFIANDRTSKRRELQILNGDVKELVGYRCVLIGNRYGFRGLVDVIKVNSGSKVDIDVLCLGAKHQNVEGFLIPMYKLDGVNNGTI